MRICDVDSFYSPRAGGVKTYHDQKVDYFRRHPEHDYTLIYADENSGVDELESNVRIIRLRGLRMDPNYRFVLNAAGLHRVLETIRPEVIEIGEPYFLPWVIRLACAGWKIPLLGYWHANFPVTYVRRPVERVSRRLGPVSERVAWWYARRTYGRLTAILAAAEEVRGRLRENGLRSTYHAPLGVDTALFNPAKRDAELRASVGASSTGGVKEGPLIFFPHRLSEEKGLTVALEAFERISRHLPATLVVAGTGPSEPVLRAHMAGNSHIRYVGYVSDRECLARWYACADLVLALSPNETFGLVALEGMASGCPVIAADGGALPALVHGGDCGRVVPHDQPKQIAEAALALLRDPEAHSRASSNARSYAVTHHSWDAAFDNIVRCYADVLASQQFAQWLTEM